MSQRPELEARHTDCAALADKSTFNGLERRVCPDKQGGAPLKGVLLHNAQELEPPPTRRRQDRTPDQGRQSPIHRHLAQANRIDGHVL